jgi:TRAP-type mannitol/chloroaromatic compound transport system permease small subunit
MLDALTWLLLNLVMAPVNLARALAQPTAWLDWSDPEALMRFIYYGGSVQFFFVVFVIFLAVTAAGVFRPRMLWGVVTALEGFQNGVGRLVAWAGLIMVVQQIVIVFAQRIFAQSSITLGLGSAYSFNISWWSEQLKLYNAMIVALCVGYTFVQKSHVRVDLVYAAVSWRARRVIDMAGSLLFMMPLAVLVWMYGWYFMWRHLVTPPVSASDGIDQMMMRARAVRWNVETIGFSPSGFNGYFLFKVLLVAFAGLVFLQAVTFFWRSYLEWREGEDAEDRLLDRDRMSDAVDGAEAEGQRV